MSASDQLYERTNFEALLDARYYARLHERHARLYRRIRIAIIVVTLFAGSTAFASAMGNKGIGVGIAGAVVTLMSILDVAFDFGTCAAAHKEHRRRYLKLIRDWPADLAAADRRLAELEAKSPGEIENLRNPSYNDNLRSNGRYSEMLKLTFFERVMSFLA